MIRSFIDVKLYMVRKNKMGLVKVSLQLSVREDFRVIKRFLSTRKTIIHVVIELFILYPQNLLAQKKTLTW